MRKSFILALTVVILAMIAACAPDLGLPEVEIPLRRRTASAEDGALSTSQRISDWSITIKGAKASTFSMQEALALPAAELELDGQTYRGVALTDVLGALEAAEVNRVAVVGKNDERIVFSHSDLNSRILLCWSKNAKPLSSLTLVMRQWGKTHALSGVKSVIIAANSAN